MQKTKQNTKNRTKSTHTHKCYKDILGILRNEVGRLHGGWRFCCGSASLSNESSVLAPRTPQKSRTGFNSFWNNPFKLVEWWACGGRDVKAHFFAQEHCVCASQSQMQVSTPNNNHRWQACIVTPINLLRLCHKTHTNIRCMYQLVLPTNGLAHKSFTWTVLLICFCPNKVMRPHPDHIQACTIYSQ